MIDIAKLEDIARLIKRKWYVGAPAFILLLTYLVGALQGHLILTVVVATSMAIATWRLQR